MAYIGKTPVLGNFVKLDAITVVNGQAAYTMQNGGVNFTSYDNVNQFLVSLNGILQSPTDSFTVSGSTLTFASNLFTGDVIDFVMVLGNTLDVGTPSDNTVSLAKLTATGTKDATTFLRGDNTFQTVSSYTDSDALSLFNVTGSAPVYACRVWIQFNGTGTIAINDSGNVSSLTDNGTGDYTLNFTTALPDVNYCFQGSTNNISTATGSFVLQAHTLAGVTTSSVRVINAYGASANTGVGKRDESEIYVAIFR